MAGTKMPNQINDSNARKQANVSAYAANKPQPTLLRLYEALTFSSHRR